MDARPKSMKKYLAALRTVEAALTRAHAAGAAGGDPCLVSLCEPGEPTDLPLVVVVNGGQQCNVDPHELAALVKSTWAALDPTEGGEVVRIITDPEWTFAVVVASTPVAAHGLALALHRLSPDGSQAATVTTLPARLLVASFGKGSGYPRLGCSLVTWVPESVVQGQVVPVSAVPGLFVVPEALSPAEEESFLAAFSADAASWDTVNGRRVRHFGRAFVYGANSFGPATHDDKACANIIDKLRQTAIEILASRGSDQRLSLEQCTINWYVDPAAGIPPHTDHTTNFGPVIAVFSLGSTVTMRWSKATAAVAVGDPGNLVSRRGSATDVSIPRRSFMWFEGEARYAWQHGIIARRKDVVFTDDTGLNGWTSVRGPRMSVTFRCVVDAP